MENIYQPPAAALLEEEQREVFFVTSIPKMTIMFLGTLGTYQVYWGYKQWSSQRGSMPKRIWPFFRGLFSIFFIHALSRRMNSLLDARKIVTRRYNDAPFWFVIIAITGTLLGRSTIPWEIPNAMAIGFDLFGLLSLIPLVGLQRKANQASGDSTGARNSRLSFSNYLCLAFGLMFWVVLVWAYVSFL